MNNEGGKAVPLLFKLLFVKFWKNWRQLQKCINQFELMFLKIEMS